MHSRAIFAFEIDAICTALRVVLLEPIGRMQDKTFRRFDLELQLVARIGIAEAAHADIAGCFHFVFDDAICCPVGIDRCRAANDLDIALQDDFAIRPAAHLFGADRRRKVFLIRLATLDILRKCIWLYRRRGDQGGKDAQKKL